MKETFVENNYTQFDVAKGVFKDHWARSVSSNQNTDQKLNRPSLLGRGSMVGGGGYAFPGVAPLRRVTDTEKEN